MLELICVKRVGSQGPWHCSDHNGIQVTVLFILCTAVIRSEH
jgi:hypothetical protein